MVLKLYNNKVEDLNIQGHILYKKMKQMREEEGNITLDNGKIPPLSWLTSDPPEDLSEDQITHVDGDLKVIW